VALEDIRKRYFEEYTAAALSTPCRNQDLHELLATPDGGAAQDAELPSTKTAATQRRHKPWRDLVTLQPPVADFGTLPRKYRYVLPVVIRNRSTYSFLFEVHRPPRTANGIQLVTVQTSHFILSPLGRSTIHVFINLPGDYDPLVDYPDGNGEVFFTVSMECVAYKLHVPLHVRAHVILDETKSRLEKDMVLPTSVLVMGPAV
jgi:hypothetical protein